jgi:HprK-related kinase B
MIGPAALMDGFDAPFELGLRIADVDVRIRTNDETIRARLEAYYEPYIAGSLPSGVIEVRLIQGEAKPEGPFQDVRRVDGKEVKEAVQEVPGGRLILKRQTGVVMGLGDGHAFAVGDLRTHLNQGINLVNACYARVIAARGHVLFHASAVSWGGRTAALAGPPGAGKSTAALHLVERGFRFLSNDRVLARPASDSVEALGYPKQPRVNPGTLVHHPRLGDLLEPGDRRVLEALSPAELWRLERKRDVNLDAIYGKGTVELRGRMQALLILKWTFGGRGFAVRQITLPAAMADLPLFQKDLGVFDSGRSVPRLDAVDHLSQYAAVFERVQVVELTGGVDFSALVDVVRDLLGK